MTITEMEKLMFGNIVLLKFPFTGGMKDKRRPALILRDTEDGDVIVCRITSKLYHTEFDFKIEDWKKCGLRLPSVIRLHKLASLDVDIIDQKIGDVNDNIQEQIKNKFTDLLK